MALREAIKSFGNGLSGEIKEFASLLRRMNYVSESGPLGINFRKFGVSFGAFEFDAYVEYAKRFYEEGMHSQDPLYSIVKLPEGRVAIDYNGEIRGIYTEKGRPLAFFRPDYRASGYRSKEEELEDFRRGVAVAWS